MQIFDSHKKRLDEFRIWLKNKRSDLLWRKTFIIFPKRYLDNSVHMLEYCLVRETVDPNTASFTKEFRYLSDDITDEKLPLTLGFIYSKVSRMSPYYAGHNIRSIKSGDGYWKGEDDGCC